MKIQIDGTHILNKGAELMLYAILEAIEIKDRTATVIYNSYGDGYKGVDTSLNLKGYERLKYGIRPSVVLRKLKLPYQFLTNFHPSKDLDLVLDGSGFKLGDQWNRDDEYLNILENYYSSLKSSNTKIILLPQALGPFETINGKRTARILNKYVDLIFARERKSYEFLLSAGVNEAKVKICSDFTNLVKGEYDDKLNVKGKVCVIPNKKMISHTSVTPERYLDKIKTVIQYFLDRGLDVFLLNHEGEGDREICNKINERFNYKLQIVDNLNAKQIKGVIGQSELVFSSRYHGVASALSQNIPCIATSWSHKYQLLFEDYGLVNQILDLNLMDNELKVFIDNFLHPDNIKLRKSKIAENRTRLERETKKMWTEVWQEVAK